MDLCNAVDEHFWMIFMKNLSRDLEFFGNFRNLTNFEELYLRAQMELKGVLGLVYMLLELVESIELTVGKYNASQTRYSMYRI